MAAIYCCSNEKRKAALRANVGMGTTPLLNAIDYLVVAAGDGPGAVPGQSELTVHFITALTTAITWNSTNVHIQGGLRNATVPLVGMPVRSGNTLKIVTALPPDPGTYTLRLTPVPDTAYDPYSLSVDFSFQSTSVTTRDCQSPATSLAARTAAPQIDYLAKDYASFRRLMLDRLVAISSEWQETNAADLGVTLVELLAGAADQLSYYQDAVATEAYLGTARTRISVRRHARLLDYFVHEGCNARALVCVELKSASLGLSLSANKTYFLTRCPGQPVILGNTGVGVPVALLDSFRMQYGAMVFQPMHDATLRVPHNVMSFYTWQDDECCLQKGATRATLLDTGLTLAKGDILVFVEQLDPLTGSTEGADPSHRYAVRLTAVEPKKDRLPVSGHETDVVDITWHEEDALPGPLCISARINNVLTVVSVALGNVVLADQGMTIPGEALTPAVPPAGERFRPALTRTGLTFAVPQSTSPPEQIPASTVLVQEPRAALPAVSCVAPDSTAWSPKVDLLHSRSTDRQFVVEMDDGRRAWLRFGDGELGQAPVSGLLASYRVGSGAAGNVAAEAIYHVVAETPGEIARVYNPLPARGGIEPESIEEVRLNVPQSFRTQERAITTDDYALLAARYPDVARASAVWRWTGAYRTALVAVVRASGQSVDAAFKQGLRAFLERYRLTGTEISIVSPLFVPLDISLTVHLADDALRGAVRDALAQIFSDVDLPDGRRGFFHPDNFGFGTPVYLGSVLAAIGAIPGVLWVDTSTVNTTNRFQRLGAGINELASGRIDIGHTELARLGSVPGSLSFGNLEFHLEGGL